MRARSLFSTADADATRYSPGRHRGRGLLEMLFDQDAATGLPQGLAFLGNSLFGEGPSAWGPPSRRAGMRGLLESILSSPGAMPMGSVRFPRTRRGAQVSGLEVGQDIPNLGSVGASGARGISPRLREVAMSEFEGTAPHQLFYAKNDIDRAHRLAEEIRQSGRIDPLIVGFDSKPGPYILEGAHRLAALHLLGAKSLPAYMVAEEGANLKNALRRRRR